MTTRPHDNEPHGFFDTRLPSFDAPYGGTYSRSTTGAFLSSRGTRTAGRIMCGMGSSDAANIPLRLLKFPANVATTRSRSGMIVTVCPPAPRAEMACTVRFLYG